MDVRIISGSLKNRRIKIPRVCTPRITRRMVRGAFFDCLAETVKGCVFLDLFSGSGAMGLEAFSRGAKQVFLVEREKSCISAIEKTLDIFFPASCPARPVNCLHMDIFRAIKEFSKRGVKFDIIFLDPPYNRTDLTKKVLIKILDYDILSHAGLVVIEHSSKFLADQETAGSDSNLIFAHRKVYGDTTLSFFRHGD